MKRLPWVRPRPNYGAALAQSAETVCPRTGCGMRFRVQTTDPWIDALLWAGVSRHLRSQHPRPHVVAKRRSA